ncbi:MAG: hypothetical protein GY856_50650, partial [bacterium]|nr:hypothetical protein [bacterium]
MSYLDSELYVTSFHQARFSWDGHDYASGKLALGGGLRNQLLELETQPETYGNQLFDAVFPKRSALREGFREALARAAGDRRRLRLRLHLAADLPADVHGLCWELLRDPDRKVAISRSPDTAFSR